MNTPDRTENRVPTPPRGEIVLPDTADNLPSGALRCTAHTSSGPRCCAPAISGATVCRVHGGSAEQVRRAAQARLADLVPAALAVLARVLDDPDAAYRDKLRAAENVLDRCGYPRRQLPEVEVDMETARALLVQRLIEIRNPPAA